MTSAIAFAYLLVASPTEAEQLLDKARTAGAAGNFAEAAEALAELANNTDGPARLPMVFAAAGNWRRAYETTGEPQHLCLGLELLAATKTDEPEIVAQQEWFEATTDSLGACQETEAVEDVAEEPVEDVAEEVAPPTHELTEPKTERPIGASNFVPQPEVDYGRTPAIRKPKVAGIVATSLAGAGVLALAAEGIVFNHRLTTYRDTPGHDEQLYQRAKAAEWAMIGTGIATSVSLATGVALLTLAHQKRKLALRPGLAGFTLQGSF